MVRWEYTRVFGADDSWKVMDYELIIRHTPEGFYELTAYKGQETIFYHPYKTKEMALDKIRELKNNIETELHIDTVESMKAHQEAQFRAETL